MVAYEFYWRDEKGKEHLVGILPERRKDPARINRDSIMNWIKGISVEEANGRSVYFIEVRV